MGEDRGRGLSPLATLTQRERQVLDLRAEGLRRKDIAAVMGISDGTVRSHTVAIYRKLEVNNIVDALRKAGVLRSRTKVR